jgi:nicotinamide mononucleotide transporter
MTEYTIQIVMGICTLLYSYLLLDCRKSAFIFGTISSIITCITFIKSGIYVQGILFLIYSIIYILTYYKWKKNESNSPPRQMLSREYIFAFGFIIIFTLVFGFIFKSMSTYPVIDAISSALSITAVFLLNRKVIEHAWFFIFSNLGSIWICCMTNEYLMILTFLIYMMFNFIRIYTWDKLMKRGDINV